MKDAIRQGNLLPGAKLPSERALARALAVSRTTVLSAYNELRASGWLESRAGSGTWVNSSLSNQGTRSDPLLPPQSQPIVESALG